MKQTDRPITAIKVNNPEIRDIINKLSEPIHRQRFSNPLQFRRTCSTNEFRFNGARCGIEKREREREMETEEKRGSKRYTRRIYTWPAPSRARTRNNVHYASLTRFLPLLACFSGAGKKDGGGRKEQSSIPSQSLANHHPPSVDALSSFSKKRRKGRERNLRSSEESANRTCDSWTRSHLSLACYCLVSIVWLAATESLRHVPKTS